ncbi:MAG: aminotransferase class I/II-fold pyridoxal phosphate-dependent enzyme, partial [Sulfobacillus sp.]
AAGKRELVRKRWATTGEVRGTAEHDDLLAALMARRLEKRQGLHVPFHGGKSADPIYADWFSLDQTELDGLDDWAAPAGLIHQAQARVAAHYHLDDACLLTAGSSQGVATAILAAVEEGGLLLSHQGAHRSLLHGLLLTGAKLRLVADVWDSRWQVGWPDVAALCEAVGRLRPQAVVVTSPTYAGLAPDLRALRLVCAQVGTVLIVDAAHGSHFGLGPLPPLASDLRPDLVILGVHKSGGAPTPGAVLGRIGDRVSNHRWQAARRAVGSSSPSYPLMAAIERAVIRLAATGAKEMANLSAVMGALIGPAVFQPPPGIAYDPTRVVVGSTSTSRPELSALGVDPEYVAPRHLLLIGTLSTQSVNPDLVTWVAAQPAPEAALAHPTMARRRREVRAAFLAAREVVALQHSVGRILAVPLVPSPPGIPLAWPGQVIDRQVHAQVRLAIAAGQEVLGLDSGLVTVVRQSAPAGEEHRHG